MSAMLGMVSDDDYGNLHFDFDDGTYAIVYWVPFGELGDGDGGEFDEASREDNTKMTGAELVKLAYANVACGSKKVPITQPRTSEDYPTSHELAKKLLELPDLPLELGLGCAHDTVLSSDSDEPDLPEVTIEHNSERVKLSAFVCGGGFSWDE